MEDVQINKNTRFIIKLIQIIKENNVEIAKVIDQKKINSKKTFTTQDLKDYIIKSYPKSKLCPCILVISEYFEDGYFCSEANDNPDANLGKYFPEHMIPIIVNLDKKCDCGFNELEKLSKKEIYDKYNKKINDLKRLLDIQISEKDQKIKELEELNKDILSCYDQSRIKTSNESYEDKSKNFIMLESCDFFKDKKTFVDFYDVIIDIKSIKDINKGWEIKMNKKGEKRFNEFKDKKALIIGIIGNSNKGKSFLLSKISKIDLPSGTSIRTEGLSIKYPELEKYVNRKIILLDTAGLETPLLLDKNYYDLNEENTNDFNELLKEKAREKIMTELFLQNFIIYNSDILITVVGILTYAEQKLLNRIKTELQRNNGKKSLYIIHNLMTYTSIEQVEQYINNFLLKSATFDLEKRTEISTKITINKESNVPYFFEKNCKMKIYHLIFANENSEAGKYYNNFTLDFFEKSYQNIINIEPFDVIQRIKERFIEASKELIEKNEKNEYINENDFYSNDDIIRERRLKLKYNRDIVLKKCYIDELGFSNLRSNGFNPYYNYYKKNNKIIIRVETPGNINLTASYKYSDNYVIVEIKGTKKKDKEPILIEDNLFNSREYGDFRIEIPLLMKLANKEPKIYRKEGITFIEYELQENIKNTHFYISDISDEI